MASLEPTVAVPQASSAWNSCASILTHLRTCAWRTLLQPCLGPHGCTPNAYHRNLWQLGRKCLRRVHQVLLD